MLEQFTPLIIITFFPLLFAEFAVLYFVFIKQHKGSTNLVWYSLAFGGIAALLVAVLSALSFFKGNFLAILTAAIFAPLVGGIAASAAFLIGLVYSLLFNNKQSLRTEAINMSSNILVLLAVIIPCVLISEAILVKEIFKLKKQYGDIMNVGGELTEAQIRDAYQNIVFRNHNLFLRGLLIRDNVPSDIIEDIYNRTSDSNVIQAVLSSSNVPKKIKDLNYKKELDLAGFEIKSKGFPLMPVNPIYNKTKITSMPGSYKLMPTLMDFDDALESCAKLGNKWKLPSREDLLLLMPALKKEQSLMTNKNEGIKTDDPKLVVSLIPFERAASARYLNRVVCISSSKPFLPLSARSWLQLPILANWYDAYEACQELGRNYKLLTVEEWSSIFSDLPPDYTGTAWTRTGYRKNWYSDKSNPDSVFYANIAKNNFEKLSDFSLHERRMLVFCKKN